jgi:hypothetical protein
MPQNSRRTIVDRGRVGLRGHGCIVLGICLLAALISFPTGW